MVAGITFLVLLALGAGVAFVLTDALGISSKPSDVPVEAASVAQVADAVAPPTFTIDAPSTPRLSLAAGELADAVAASAHTAGTATLTVTVGTAATGDDGYTLGGTAHALTITAPSETGAVRGVYDLAAAVRDGRSVTAQLGKTITSALPFRMVDLGAVGVTAGYRGMVGGHRLLAQLEGVRGRHPARPPPTSTRPHSRRRRSSSRPT